jgi:hypothetical protein
MSDTRSEIPGVSLGILVNEKLVPNEVNLALKLIEGMPAELARSR